MKIGRIVQNYLDESGMSQRQFAKKCGLSNGYISMIVNGANPKTGKPLVPSLSALMCLSRGIGISFDELLTKADDISINVSLPTSDAISPDEQMLLDIFRLVPEDQKDLVLSMIKAALGRI
jgi:transcriptional regulator with XRE-family HTH domain